MKLFVMAATIVKNLLKGPATRRYPKKKRVFSAIARGRIENTIAKCIFCGLCARRCPTYAITVTKDSREWCIDRLKCCICNLCVEICPTKCLATHNQYSPPVTAKLSGLCTRRQESSSPEEAES